MVVDVVLPAVLGLVLVGETGVGAYEVMSDAFGAIGDSAVSAIEYRSRVGPSSMMVVESWDSDCAYQLRGIVSLGIQIRSFFRGRLLQPPPDSGIIRENRTYQ